MKFTYLTKAAFEALTEYQQEKYIDDKRNHEMNETKLAAEEAAKTAVDEAVASVKTELTATIDAQKTEIASFKVTLDERDKKIESAMAEMNRLKAGENVEAKKNMSTEIYRALTEKDENGKSALERFNANKGVKMNLNIEGRAVTKAPGVVGVTAGTVADDWIGNVDIPHEAVQARNIIPVLSTSSENVKYVQFTKGQGKIGSVNPGATKPQLDIVSTPKNSPIVKIAGWITVQEEFLEDVDGAPEFLARELPAQYLDEETRQIFKGVGTDLNPNELVGLFSKIASAVAFSNGVTSASNPWDIIAMALTNTRRALRPGDAVWTSPEMYMELLINKSKGATLFYDYPVGADTSTGRLTIGGIPIYFHSVFNNYEGLVGNFSRGVTLFQKKAINLRVADQHDINFIQNLITMLIEARVTLPCYFPESFKKLDFSATT